MHGNLTINTIIMLVLAILAVAIGVAFYMASGKTATDNTLLQKEKISLCSSYVKIDPYCNLNEDGNPNNDAPSNLRVKLRNVCQQLKYTDCDPKPGVSDPGDALRDSCTQHCCAEFCLK